MYILSDGSNPRWGTKHADHMWPLNWIKYVKIYFIGLMFLSFLVKIYVTNGVLSPSRDKDSLNQVPTAFSEGKWGGRGQGSFLFLGWETILEGGWTTIQPKHEIVEENGNATTLLFLLEWLKIALQEH